MKKSILLALAFSLALVVQGQKYGGPPAVNTATTNYERETTHAVAKLNVEYPTDGEQAYIDAYNAEVVDYLLAMAQYDDSTVIDLPTSVEDALPVIALVFLSSAEQDVKEMSAEVDDPEYLPHFSYDAEVKKTFSNHLYVTFFAEGYTYTGGAHGLPWSAYFSLDRKTGHRYVRSDLFPPSVEAKLAAIVRRNIIAQNPEAKEMLEPNFGLPGDESVGLSAKGVTFRYQPYEIGPYAIGQPEATVPWAQLYSILTAKGKALSLYKPTTPVKKHTPTRRR